MSNQDRMPYQWLYAKTDCENPDQIHLLLYHLLDVGTVAHAMWQSVWSSPTAFANK